jgi:hypothetical protein
MRISVLMGCILLASVVTATAVADWTWHLENLNPGNPSGITTGAATTIGTGEGASVYVSRANSGRNIFATLEGRIRLDAWRGKRLRLTFQLKDYAARSEVIARIEKSNGAGVVSVAERNANHSGSGDARQFVLDVPDNATDLAIDVRALGNGTVYVGDIKLTAADAKAPLSRIVRIDYSCSQYEQEPCDPADAGRRAYLSWISAVAGYEASPMSNRDRTF